jgi:hypothetical protein
MHNYIDMLMRVCTMLLIAIAMLSFFPNNEFPNNEFPNFIDSTCGKLVVVSIAILASSHNIIYGLAVAFAFMVVTKTNIEGFTDDISGNKQSDLKLAYRKKICDPRFAAQSPANKTHVSEMTKSMTMTFPGGPCNPCSQPSTGCNFELSGEGSEQLRDIRPQNTRTETPT